MKNISNISANVMQHYKLAKKWKSDLDYLLKESRFLHHLFDGYYLSFSSEYYIKQLRTIESVLRVLDRNIKEIAGFLEIKLATIDGVVAGNCENDTPGKVELLEIEKKINRVQMEFRALKETLFQFVESTEDRNETLSFLDKSA